MANMSIKKEILINHHQKIFAKFSTTDNICTEDFINYKCIEREQILLEPEEEFPNTIVTTEEQMFLYPKTLIRTMIHQFIPPPTHISINHHQRAGQTWEDIININGLIKHQQLIQMV